MEAFSLLRYWRSNPGDATSNADVTTSTATTIVTAVSGHTSETGEHENDHGPFFDLEFSLPAEHGETENRNDYGEEEEDSDGSDDVADERELKFTLVSGSSSDCTADVNVAVSPSDELFFKGTFVPVEQTEEEINFNSKPLQTRVSLMKSATKLRVMMLNFKKSKLKTKSMAESNQSTDSYEEQKNDEEKVKADRNAVTENSGKSTAVKYKAAEDAPIVSLFKRHNSSKAPKKRPNENETDSNSPDEKKFSRETMQKYLRKVKPLYVRVSKRYGEKLKFTGQQSSLSLPAVTKLDFVRSPATEEQNQSPAANRKRDNETTSEISEPPLLPSNVKELKQGNLPAGLRVVCKHLKNSRSVFTAVAAAPPGTISSKRRDDSLLQQQDGIQSAILHCKRSFKASRDSDCSSSSASDDAVVADRKCENSWSSDAADGKERRKSTKSDQKAGKSYDGVLGF